MGNIQDFISSLPGPFNKMNNFSQMINKTREALKGQNPEEFVRNQLNNGVITQEQFNQAAKLANMIRPHL